MPTEPAVAEAPHRHVSTKEVEIPWCDACDLGSFDDQCQGCSQPYTILRKVPR
jgi:hypothetical protein